MSNTRQKYISLGLCPACGKDKPVEGRTKCANCLKKDNENARKRRERRKQNGICIMCTNTNDGISVFCEKCKELNAQRNKIRYEKNKKNGKCTICSKDAVDGTVYCKYHKDIIGEYHKERRKFLIEQNLCAICGGKKELKHLKHCQNCLEIASWHYRNLSDEKKREYYENKKIKVLKRYEEEGICVRCGKNKAFEGSTLCSNCLKKQRIRYRIRKEKDGTIKRCERVSYGLCYMCGNKLDTNKKLCSTCIEKVGKNLGHNNKSHTWRKENRLIYGRGN